MKSRAGLAAPHYPVVAFLRKGGVTTPLARGDPTFLRCYAHLQPEGTQSAALARCYRVDWRTANASAKTGEAIEARCRFRRAWLDAKRAGANPLPDGKRA
jgi:hypothetical protein